MAQSNIENKILIEGETSGPVLYSNIGLSFWGGVDPLTGIVIDQNHPLFGQSISQKILVIRSGRGSCTGSCVMLELILNGCAPLALVFCEQEYILPLGVMIAEEIFGKSLPVIKIQNEEFLDLINCSTLRIEKNILYFSDFNGHTYKKINLSAANSRKNQIQLSEYDDLVLEGKYGEASQLAMKIIIRMAELYGAEKLVNVSQAHIDSCIYIGPGGLAFIKNLREAGAKTAIPTSLNAISIDLNNWKSQGVSKKLGGPSEQLVQEFMQIGAKPTFTCAPYLLDSAPKYGELVAWGESNAVVYANSILGARTIKYPDYLDICVAITGRAPYTGCYIGQVRVPQIIVDVHHFKSIDTSFFPLLGYHIGLCCPNKIPYVKGISHLCPNTDDLKSFGAAFATTSASPMFHIEGITPEADLYKELISNIPCINIKNDDLKESWLSMNSAHNNKVDLIAIGNPHASYNEIKLISELCRKYMGYRRLKMIITCGGSEYNKSKLEGFTDIINKFGAEFVLDTCWCMITEPLIPAGAQVIMTNSGKYAHYATALTGRLIRFGSLEDCIKVACGWSNDNKYPSWLDDD